MIVRFAVVTLASVLTGGVSFAQTAADPFANANVSKNLSYGPHERNKLDLAVPKGDGPFPLLIWIHGGGWEGGNKDGFGVLRGQVPRGYAIASINYRFSKHAPFPAQIVDSKAAVRFLRTNSSKYKLDANRIGVAGASAGGHLAALLGTSDGVKALEPEGTKPGECTVHAVVDFFGPADLTKLSPPGSPENPVVKLLGGDSGEKKALAKAGTPQTHADKSDPPFLIVHGDADRLVPLSQSKELNDALSKAGVSSELRVIANGGHGVGIFTKDTTDAVNAFWDRHVKARTP